MLYHYQMFVLQIPSTIRAHLQQNTIAGIEFLFAHVNKKTAGSPVFHTMTRKI